jgi:hypothetical protein
VTIVARQWLPSAAVVPQERGTEYLGPVDGADWSDGIGFHRGFFSAFVIRAGKSVWFHFPMPTPVEQGGKPLFLESVSLLWEAAEGVKFGWVIVQHGGMDRIPLTERLVEPASTAVPFDPPEQWREYYPATDRRLTTLRLNEPLRLQFGVQICVLINADEQSDGLIRFYGAGADFSDA